MLQERSSVRRLQQNLIINIPLVIPQTEGLLSSMWSVVILVHTTLVPPPRLQPPARADTPSLFICGEPEPDRNLAKVLLFPVLSVMTASIAP